MRKTIFAGLTVLNPDESLFTDNGSFLSRDRDEIDRALQIGVKTHRHDGSAGLTDPSLAPSATVLGSGGTIDAGQTITLGYTLEDEHGGETLLSPAVTLTTPSPIDQPLSAPSAALDYSGGSLLTATYYYAVSYTDGQGGETPLGPVVVADRAPGYPNAQVLLTHVNAGIEDTDASGWRLYRARDGGEYAFLASGGVSDEDFTDDGSLSPDCDAHPLTDNQNTTGKVNRLQVNLPTDVTISAATFINLYGSISGDFAQASLMQQYPVASAGSSDIYTSLTFLDSQPPDVNRSYGGANQIDPDTELIDFPWKRPVDSFGDLPSSGNTDGDVRETRDTHELWTWTGSAWELAQVGGGGGGGGSLDVFASGAASGSPAVDYTDDFSVFDSGWSLQQDTGPLSDEFTLSGTSWIGADGFFVRQDPLLIGDSEATNHFIVSSNFGIAGVLLKIDESPGGTFLQCAYQSFTGMKIEVSLEGVTTTLETDSLSLSDTDERWVRASLVDDLVTCELWSTDPELGGTADSTLTHTLDPGNPEEAAFIGSSMHPGACCYGTDWEWLDYHVEGDGGGNDSYVVAATGIEFVGSTVSHGVGGVAVVNTGVEVVTPSGGVVGSGGVFDDFDTDTIASGDWQILYPSTPGSTAGTTISSGKLLPEDGVGTVYALRSDVTNDPEDTRDLRIVSKVGEDTDVDVVRHVLGWVDEDNYLAALYDFGSGLNDNMGIYKWIGGTPDDLNSDAGAYTGDTGEFWFVTTVAGPIITAYIFDVDPDVGSPTELHSVTFDMTSDTDYAALLQTATQVGVGMLTNFSGAYFDSVLMEGFPPEVPTITMTEISSLDLRAGAGIVISAEEDPTGRAVITISLA